MTGVNISDAKNVPSPTSIGVLGAGTWGMALARMLTNLGHEVMVWSALPEEIERLRATRRQVNLPDMVIPDATGFTTRIEEACLDRDVLLFAVPSVYVRATARAAAPFIRDGQIITPWWPSPGQPTPRRWQRTCPPPSSPPVPISRSPGGCRISS